MSIFRHKPVAFALVVVALLCLSVMPVFAQDADAFGGAIGGMKSLYGSLATLLKIAIGIGALVVLAMIVFRIMQGDRESAGKLAWWLIGLAFGFIMINALQGVASYSISH